MIDDQQLEILTQWEHDEFIEREQFVRRTAIEAASKGAHSTFAYMDHRAYRDLWQGELSTLPPTITSKTIHVYLGPWARGFARVLLAEKQIRDQIG